MMESKPKNRFKLTQACDRCRTKRMRCDGHYPRCGPCLIKEVNCTYNMSSKRRGPKMKSALKLEERVKELEELLKLKNKGIVENLEDVNNALIPPTHYFNNINNDVLILSDSQPDYTLPSESVMTDLIDLFFSITHPTIRFIHKPTLLNRLNSDNKPYLLLNAIFALSARFSKHAEIYKPEQPRYLNGEIFATRLISLLNVTLISQPTLDTIQALILLGLNCYGKMKGFSSWNYIGIAIRLAQQLGLNIIDSYHHQNNIPRLLNEDWITIECKRRTWWGCFIADRFASSLVGRSLYIDERDCLVHMPSEDARWDTRFSVVSKLAPTNLKELLDFGNDLANSKSVFCDLSSHFITLINLSGLTTRYLMHRAALGMTYDLDYQELIQLDHLLTKWATNLPAKFHRPQNYLENLDNTIIGFADIFLVVSCMFAMYHGTIIALHRGNLSHAQKDVNSSEMVLLSKNRCIFSANEIGQLLNDAWFRLSDISDPYFPFFIFNAATIHANFVYLEPESNQTIKSKEYLDKCTKALIHFSDIWLMSRIFLEMLETLIITLNFEQDLNASNFNHTPHPSPSLVPVNDAMYINSSNTLPIKSGIWEVFSISYFDWFYSISNRENFNQK